MKKIVIEKSLLKKLYIQQGLSSLDIAKMFGCSWLTVNRNLKRQGLKVRTHKEKTVNAFKRGKMKHTKKMWEDTKKRWTASSGNPRWKPLGSKREDGHGYIYIKYRDGFGFKNWMQEHRFVMEKKLGRSLEKTEVVHHLNHDKSDNRLSNLRLMGSSEHKSHHAKDTILKGRVR